MAEPLDQPALKPALPLDFQDKNHVKLRFPVLAAWSSVTDKHPFHHEKRNKTNRESGIERDDG